MENLSNPTGRQAPEMFRQHGWRLRKEATVNFVTTSWSLDGWFQQAAREIGEARAIRTPNLLIWSQTRYHCAIAPLSACITEELVDLSPAIVSSRPLCLQGREGPVFSSPEVFAPFSKVFVSFQKRAPPWTRMQGFA